MAIAIYEIKIPSSDTFRIFVDFPDEFTSIGLQKATDAIEEEIKEYYSDNAVINKYVQDFVVLYGGAVDTKLKEKIQSLIDEIACDFYKHEPFIDPIARKHVHETLDKLQQKFEEMCKKMDEKFAEWEELSNEIRSIKPIQPLDIPEPRKLQQTEARQWFHEQAGNATLEERQQTRQWFHEQARKATPEEREVVHKELTMKRDLAKAQEALSKVQQLDKEIKSLLVEIDERLKELLAQNTRGAQGGKDADSKL